MADRIPLNPSIDVNTSVPRPSFDASGTLDSGGINTGDAGSGMTAQILDPSMMGKEMAGPANLPATWSSGPDNNDYLAKQ